MPPHRERTQSRTARETAETTAAASSLRIHSAGLHLPPLSPSPARRPALNLSSPEERDSEGEGERDDEMAVIVSDFAFEQRDAQSAVRVRQQARDVPLQGTKRVYAPAQKRWNAWCLLEGFPEASRYTVYEAKLARYLTESLLAPRTTKPTKAQLKSGVLVDNVPYVVQWSVLNTAICAIIQIYYEQVELKINTHPYPRTGSVKGICDTHRKLCETHCKQTTAHKRKTYVNRGAGTLLDRLTSVDTLALVTRQHLERGTAEGLRDASMYLSSFFGGMRGHNTRSMELLDLHCVELNNEGASKCLAVVILLDNGKPNQSGRVETAGMIRSKNVLECPVFAMAAHLFYMFNLSAAPFPDFSSPQLWYNHLVYPKSAANPLVQIKYTGHLKAVNLAHAKAGIASLNATHFGRGAAARSASLGGPSMAGIQAAGRCNQTSLSASYLIALPREGMRVLAGFPKDGGGFYIPRATVKVPSALAEAVFPGAKAWLDRHLAGEFQTNLATRGFLQLLGQLGEVLVQDMVQIRNLVPNCVLFDADVFQSDAFLAYERQATASIQVVESPAGLRLQLAMPALVEYINAKFDSQRQDLNIVREEARVMALKVDQIAQLGIDVLSGLVPLPIRAQYPSNPAVSPAPILSPSTIRSTGPSTSTPNPPTMTLAELQLAFAAVSAQVEAVSAQVEAAAALAGELEQPSDELLLLHAQIATALQACAPLATPTATIPGSTHTLALPNVSSNNPLEALIATVGGGARPIAASAAAIITAATAAANEPPHYHMSRTVQKVTDLWREFSVGIGGQPSVRAKYGTGKGVAWGIYGGDTERKFFAGRVAIIDGAARRAKETNQAVEVVIAEMELKRTQNKWSLHKLGDHLKNGTLWVA